MKPHRPKKNAPSHPLLSSCHGNPREEERFLRKLMIDLDLSQTGLARELKLSVKSVNGVIQREWNSDPVLNALYSKAVKANFVKLSA